MFLMIPQIPWLGLVLEHYYIGGSNVTTIIKLLMNLHVLRNFGFNHNKLSWLFC